MVELAIEEAVTRYWDARAPHFDAAASHVAQEEAWREVLEAAFCAAVACDVIDLGTGTGACALIAAGLGHRVRGFDGSRAMLLAARGAAAARGLDIAFTQRTIGQMRDTDGPADIVCLRNVLWTLEQPARALAVARRLLRPHGLVLVSDGYWAYAPAFRSTYDAALAERLPYHGGLREPQARLLLTEAGFTDIRSWQHLFRASPYPGDVPMFVVTARAEGEGGVDPAGLRRS